MEDQSTLFETILTLTMRGKLVLWAGAGLSMEAGYPSGLGLRDFIWNKLTKEEMEELQPGFSETCTTDLKKLTGYLVYKGTEGKKRLLDYLDEVFNTKPEPSESHEIIRKLSFIKTIITTNYDRTFEKTDPELEIILDAKGLAKSKANSRKLIKIHGDLQAPKKLILTEEDYTRLYSKSDSNPFWSRVQVEITEKAVLFIGYGFDDLHVRNFFDQIQKKLKAHTLPKYLVAPVLSVADQDKLKAYQIQYFDSTGKDFLRQLFKAWQVIGYRNFADKEVLVDDLMGAMKEVGINLTVGLAENNGRKLGFNPIDKNELLQLTFESKDVKVQELIRDWKSGFGDDRLIIPKSSIERGKLSIGGMVVGDHRSFPELLFERVGQVYENVLIYFPEANLESGPIKARVYNTLEKSIKIDIEAPGIKLTLHVSKKARNGFKVKVDFTPSLKVTSVQSFLNWHALMIEFIKGKAFKVSSPDISNEISFSGLVPMEVPETLRNNHLVFQIIQDLCDRKKMRFENLTYEKIFQDSELKKLNMLLEIKRKGYLQKPFTGGILFDKENYSRLKFISDTLENNPDRNFLFETPNEILQLFGQPVDMGKKQLFLEQPYITDIDPDKKRFRVKSLDNQVYIFLEIFGLNNYDEA